MPNTVPKLAVPEIPEVLFRIYVKGGATKAGGVIGGKGSTPKRRFISLVPNINPARLANPTLPDPALSIPVTI
jgi:hypothetical protein